MKKFLPLILVLVLVFSLAPIAAAADAANTGTSTDRANALKDLGLFVGTDRGFELDRAPVRTEAVVMLLRMMGEEKAALDSSHTDPFTDVPQWAEKYVSYAYYKGYAYGISATSFGSNEPVTPEQFITFMLRTLGYSDKAGDFLWSGSVSFAEGLGIIDAGQYQAASGTFTRSDCVDIMFHFLSAAKKGSSATLAQELIASNVIDADKAAKYGLYESKTKDDTKTQYNLAEARIKAPSDYSGIIGNITVSGKVSTIDGKPVEGATVYMVCQDEINKISLLDVTDMNGSFSIQDVLPGKYNIVFGKENYNPVTITAVIGDSSKNFDQVLESTSNPVWLMKETDRMIYHYKEGQEISDIEIEAQEERLEFIENFLGVKVKEKIGFYMASSQREASMLAFGHEDFRADAFYIEGKNAIYTIGGGFSWHETSHAVANILNPDANTSLNEGLAVFFGWGEIGSPLQYHTPINTAAGKLMESNRFFPIPAMLKSFNNNYTQCGSFVTFLLKSYSAEQFIQLFRRMPEKPTDEEIESILYDIYGKSSFQLYNEWRVYLIAEPVAESGIIENESALAMDQLYGFMPDRDWSDIWYRARNSVIPYARRKAA